MKALIILCVIACIFSGCKKEYTCNCGNGERFPLGKSTQTEAGTKCAEIAARDSVVCAVPI